VSLVLRAGPVSARVEPRVLVVTVGLAVAALAVGFVALARGATWSPPGDVLAAFVGGGRSPVVILEWRLPRVVGGIVFGAALGLAGAVVQNLTRNALGSPDVIGLDAGAYTGALIVLTTAGTAGALVGVSLAVAAVTGGLLTAAVVLALAADRGAGGGAVGTGRTGLRLVVVGIAVNAVLVALNAWIVMRAELEVAIAGSGWNAGSLNGVDWAQVGPAVAIVVLLAGVLALLAPSLHQQGLGDDLAAASGVDLRVLWFAALAAGVGASAVVTAVAGPILFVALAAPQVGRRLAGAAGVPLAPAAATGALMLVGADLLAQVLLAPAALPVGVVTTAVGGAYLIWLLAREVPRR
jgi:iron complex transport system permease protein